MADLKISALTASTTPLAGTEVLPIVQSSTTKQVSVANLTAGRAVSVLSLAATAGNVSTTGAAREMQALAGASFRLQNAAATANWNIATSATALVVSSPQGGIFTVSNPTSVTGDITASTGNVVIGTAAKGINFTANTPAAGMTSQLLNWYEEGVSTVTLAFGGGSTGIVYSSQQCRYTRIGNRVMFQIGLAISNAGSSTGAATISGLPFTSKNIGYGSNLFAVNAQNMAGVAGVIFAVLPENSSTIALKNINVAGNANVDFTNTAWGAGSYVTISGQYLVA